MPCPRSFTKILTQSSSFSSAHTRISRPGGENLIALETRLIRSWTIRAPSARNGAHRFERLLEQRLEVHVGALHRDLAAVQALEIQDVVDQGGEPDRIAL